MSVERFEVGKTYVNEHGEKMTVGTLGTVVKERFQHILTADGFCYVVEMESWDLCLPDCVRYYVMFENPHVKPSERDVWSFTDLAEARRQIKGDSFVGKANPRIFLVNYTQGTMTEVTP